MHGRVFISHSSLDAIAAKQVCSALEANGIACWIAPRDIPAGTSWPTAIAGALEQASGLVLLFSSAAAASEEVKSELILARQRRIPLLPVRLEAIRPSGDMAFFLANTQWIDATARHLSDLLPEICAGMRRALSGYITAPTREQKATPIPRFKRDFRGHDEPIEFVSISDDGRSIVTAAWDLTIKVWDPQSGRCTATLKGHEGSATHQGTVYAAVPVGSKIVSGGSDGTLRIWDSAGRATTRKTSSPIHALAAVPNSDRVLAGSADGSIREWNSTTSREVAHLTTHQGTVRSLSCDAKGQSAVSCGDDRTVRLLDLSTGSEREVTSLKSTVLTVAVSSDGDRALLGTADGKVVLIELPSMKPLNEIKGHGDAVRGLAFLTDGRGISAGRDGAVKLWDMSTGLCDWNGTEYTPPINGLAAQGGNIAVGSADGVLRLYCL